jgi:hypothetical protein
MSQVKTLLPQTSRTKIKHYHLSYSGVITGPKTPNMPVSHLNFKSVQGTIYRLYTTYKEGRTIGWARFRYSNSNLKSIICLGDIKNDEL